MIRIAHISDIHIKNFSRIEDYKYSFEFVYNYLKSKNYDFVIITGDIAHTKLQLSPEYFYLATEFITNLSNLCKNLILILGNHDRSLNKNRLDAITPVLKAINKNNIHLIENSNITFGKYNFINSDFNNIKKFIINDKVNILLYHGILRGAHFDNNNICNSEKYLGIKELKEIGIDFGFFGDLHSFQYLDNDKKFFYAGSLIQQNYGESIDKYFVDIELNDRDIISNPVLVDQRSLFLTIKNYNDFDIIKNINDKLLNIRVIGNNEFIHDIKIALNKLKYINITEKKFILEDNNTKTKLNAKLLEIDNIDKQNEIISNFIRSNQQYKNYEKELLSLNSELEFLNDTTNIKRFFNIKKISWSNFGCYSDGEINFENGSFFGIFAPNAKGKSTVIDVILYSIFGNSTKGNKVEIINNDKDSLQTYINIDTDNNHNIEITRILNRNNIREVNLIIDGNAIEGDKTEIENTIKNTFGTIDDFLMKNCIIQFDTNNIITLMKGKKRKEYIITNYGVDILNKKYLYIKNELSSAKREFNKLSDSIGDIEQLKIMRDNINNRINENTEFINNLKSKLNSIINFNKSDFNGDKYNKYLERISKLIKIIRTIDFNMDDTEYISNSVNDNINGLNKKLSDINNELTNKRRQLSRIENKLDIKIVDIDCNRTDCPFMVEYNKKLDDIKNNKMLYDKLNNEIIELEKQYDSTKNDLNTMINIVTQYNNKNLIISNYNITLLELRNSFINYLLYDNDTSNTINKLEKQIKETEKALQNDIYQLGITEQKIKSCENNLLEFKKLENKMNIYKLYEEMLSPNNLQKIIFENIIEILNNEMKNILSNFKFTVKFIDEEDKLNIYIEYMNGSKRVIELCSGMERTIANIVTRLAFLKLKSNYNLFIFDEVFASFDETKVQNIDNIFDWLLNNNYKILLISHDLTLKDRAKEIIDIIYNNETKLSSISF